MDSETKTPETLDTYKVISFHGEALPRTYKGVVISQWLHSLRTGNDYFKLIESDAYYTSYKAYVLSLLQHPFAMVNLAVLTDDQDVVLGWSMHRGDTLDYVHVHKHNRLNGIGKSLILAEVKTISHLTRTGLSIWSAKFPKAHFNPF